MPEAVLAHAAQRGSRVHAICAAMAQGLWVPSVPEECAGYVESFRKWLPVVEEVVAVEVELVDENLGFLGHPDLIVRMRGDRGLSLTDLKTPAGVSPLWKCQLAAYKHLAEVNGYPISRVFSLRLSPTGAAPKLDEYRDSPRDLAAFLSALNAYRYFKAA